MFLAKYDPTRTNPRHTANLGFTHDERDALVEKLDLGDPARVVVDMWGQTQLVVRKPRAGEAGLLLTLRETNHGNRWVVYFNTSMVPGIEALPAFGQTTTDGAFVRNMLRVTIPGENLRAPVVRRTRVAAPEVVEIVEAVAPPMELLQRLARPAWRDELPSAEVLISIAGKDYICDAPLPEVLDFIARYSRR